MSISIDRAFQAFIALHMHYFVIFLATLLSVAIPMVPMGLGGAGCVLREGGLPDAAWKLGQRQDASWDVLVLLLAYSLVDFSSLTAKESRVGALITQD